MTWGIALSSLSLRNDYDSERRDSNFLNLASSVTCKTSDLGSLPLVKAWRACPTGPIDEDVKMKKYPYLIRESWRMFRTLIRMSEEVAAKRLKISPPLIGTHKSVVPAHIPTILYGVKTNSLQWALSR